MTLITDEPDASVMPSCRVLVLARARMFAGALAHYVSALPGFTAVIGDVREPLVDDAAIVLYEPSVDPERARADARRLVERLGAAKLVILAGASPAPDRLARELRASGCLTRDATPAMLSRALHDARDGRKIAAARRRPGASSPIDTLTVRERHIAALLASGRGAADLAQLLGISPHTVRTHMQNIMIKLGAHTRLEASMLARRAGLAVRTVDDASAGAGNE